MSIPWGINTVHNVWARGRVIQTCVDGRWVKAVATPYHPNLRERIRAAWWVLTGRAHAFKWPEPGDFETLEGREA